MAARTEVTASDSRGRWDRSCYISPDSVLFVLHTEDGRMIRFDEASNDRIAEKLRSTQRVLDSSKIFRVRVTGSMNGDTLSITDIEI